jgi:hypothetical protein
VPLWSELVCVIAEYRPVVITMSGVGYAYGAFRDAHAFVAVFIGRGMVGRQRRTSLMIARTYGRRGVSK